MCNKKLQIKQTLHIIQFHPTSLKNRNFERILGEFQGRYKMSSRKDAIKEILKIHTELQFISQNHFCCIFYT